MNRVSPNRAAALAVLAVSFATAAPAEETPRLLSNPPSGALLFKSGQSYLTKTFTLERGTTSLRVPLAPAIHGTVWLSSEKGRVASATSRMVLSDEERDLRTLADLLESSLGKNVELELMDNPVRHTLAGRLVRLLGPGWPRIAGGPGMGQPADVVVQTDGALHTVPMAKIVGVSIPGGEAPPRRYRAAVETAALDVQLASATKQQDLLELSYMANGLSWAPSYELALGPGDRGRLRGKAVVVNDLEKLENTSVRLVIGYPNIRFGDMQTVLYPGADISRLLQDAESSRFANIATQRVSVAPGFARADFETAAPQVSGSASEDLYIYDIGRLSLDRGERAYVPLTDEEVRYRHRFDWELADAVDGNARFMGQYNETPVPVWHVLLLTNGSKAPWTTAPLLVIGDAGPLAQSELDYTPPTAEALVRLTQALDVRGKALEFRDEEESTQRQTVTLFRQQYERVLIKGSLELENFSGRAVPMHVVKHLSGDLVRADGNPKVDAGIDALGQVNRRRTLTWEFDLKPGGTWRAEYTYQVLIRR